MKAQSFEYHLRHTISPTPDSQARLRARAAALAEFERIYAQRDKPSVPARAGIRDFLGGWASRNTLLGGIASACVVVIAASVFLLTPPQQRQIPVRVPVADTPPTSVQPVETEGKS